MFLEYNVVWTTMCMACATKSFNTLIFFKYLKKQYNLYEIVIYEKK